MRRAARVDANQTDIMRALRKIGCVLQDLSSVGGGCPDLAVGWRGKLVMLEVKDGSKAPSARVLTPAQVEWHERWQGMPVRVVMSPAEAIQAVQEMTA